MSAYAQNSMGIGTETPNPNAVLEIVSPSGNQGILIPRYTTAERTATAFTSNLTDTDNGLMVFDTDEGSLYFWYSGVWVAAANQTFSEMLATDSDAGAQNITNLADPVNDQDAATKAYVDTLFAGIVIPTFSEQLLSDNDAGASSIANLANPVDAQDAATKSYVDTLVGGIVIPSFSDLLLQSDDAGASNITNLADPLDGQDAATKSYVDTLFGGIVIPTFAEQLLSDNDAGASSITNLADPTDGQDAATKAYVDTLFAGSGSSPWTITGSDLSYNLGNVGVGTDAPISPFQVQDKLHFFDFVVDSMGIDGRIIADNMYYDGAALRNVQDGRLSFFYMTDGNIEFLTADSALADEDRFNQIETTLTLKSNRNAEFRGTVEIGSVQDSTDLSSGQLAYNGGSLYLYTGAEWKDLVGLSLPYQSTVNGVSNLLDLENTGNGSVAYFNLNNSTSTSNAVNIITNSSDPGSSALYVNNDGFGPAAEFNITSSGNNEYAMAARTVGVGSAAYFETNNGSSSTPTISGNVVNGGGSVLDLATSGTGRIAYLSNNNASNSANAFTVTSSGSGTTALFSNSNTGTFNNTVQIINAGNAAGLSIQNQGATTSFGLTNTITGNLNVVGNHSTTGAVSSNAISITSAVYSVSNGDHIIGLNGTSAQTITLPDPSSFPGRELILMYTSTPVLTHTINVSAGTILFEANTVSSVSMSNASVKLYV